MTEAEVILYERLRDKEMHFGDIEGKSVWFVSYRAVLDDSLADLTSVLLLMIHQTILHQMLFE
jgi:hypothetical protein